MTQNTDHFDNALHDPEHQHEPSEVDPEHQEYEDVDVEETEKKSWRPSQNVVVGFCIMLGVAGFFGYKKLSKPEMGGGGYDQVDVSALPAEGNAGMMAPPSPPQAPPAPTEPAPAQVKVQQPPNIQQAPITSAEQQLATAPQVTSSAAGQVGGSVLDQVSASPANQQQSAQQIQRVSELESEVASLKATVAKLTAAQAPAPTQSAVAAKASVKPVGHLPAKATNKVKAPKREDREAEQVGYRIRQIVPGQGWVETDAGKLFVVGVGDKIGGAEVLAIDAESYRITTTAGVIK